MKQNLKKLRLLLWKNYTLQKRHKLMTALEIFSPVLFSLILVLVRVFLPVDSRPQTHYGSFDPLVYDVQNRSNSKVGGSKGPETKKNMSLAFSPNSQLTLAVTMLAMKELLDKNQQYTRTSENNGFVTFHPVPLVYNSAEEMQKALVKHKAMESIFLGIEFDDAMSTASEWPKDIVFSLRFPAIMRTPLLVHPLQASWRTSLIYPAMHRPGPREPYDKYGGNVPGYYREMFLCVQHAISRQLIRATSAVEPPPVVLQRYPQLKYRVDDILVALERFLAIVLILAFAYTAVNTVRMVAIENELQLKETMRIMGVPNSIHWVAWFIKQYSYMFFSCVLLTIMLKLPLKVSSDGSLFAIMTFTPWTIILFYLMLFISATITFCFMISTFFSKASTAASFMALVWFLTLSPFMLTQVIIDSVPMYAKCILSLFSNSAIGFAFQMMVTGEGSMTGLQWDSLFKEISFNDPFYPGHVMLLLMLDAVLYMLVALYVEKISPGSYGVPLPWYYPFTRSYWRGMDKIDPDDMPVNMRTSRVSIASVVREPEPPGGIVGVNISKLTKIYKGKKMAVNNLTMKLFENEITVLLGHNGAGKTTTMSMLTGMIPPTSGSATINGYDIMKQTTQARKSLGLCPQHNVLFPELTVVEHIHFYSRLKGVPKDSIEAEIEYYVNVLDLAEKRTTLAMNLSGGQQRRLSVGAAMCGASKVVLLDEPTSGLDPSARRALWDLLLLEKKGRTMILSTHFMDEADILGDRVAIMAGGQLQCYGSPFFLKKNYGGGYKLTVVKGDGCRVGEVSELLARHVPETQLNMDIGLELTYLLPNEARPKFTVLLRELEESKKSLGISSYGLSVTTLEEVFMKVARGMECGIFPYDHLNPMFTEDTRSNEMVIPSPLYDLVSGFITMFSFTGVIHIHIAGAEDYSHLDEDEEDTTTQPGSPEGHNMKHQDEVSLSEQATTIQKVGGKELTTNHVKGMFFKLGYTTIRNTHLNIIQLLMPLVSILVTIYVVRSWQFLSDLSPFNLNLAKVRNNFEVLVSAPQGDSMEMYRDSYKRMFDGSRYFHVKDVGSENVEDKYLEEFRRDRLGARVKYMFGATFTNGSIVGWFSNYGYHDPAVSLSIINDAIMRRMSQGRTLTVYNKPLPYTFEEQSTLMASGASVGFQFAFNLGHCMSFLTSFMVLFVIKERVSGAKLLQLSSGLQPGIMWLCSFIWDWLWFMLISIEIILILAYFQQDTLSTPTELGRVLLVLMIFGYSMLPFHYALSFIFNVPATGYAKVSFINVFSGMIPFLVSEIFSLPDIGLHKGAKAINYIFAPIPSFCICRCLKDLSVSSFSMSACSTLCDLLMTNQTCTLSDMCNTFNVELCCIEENPFFSFTQPGIAFHLTCMMVSGTIIFALILCYEYGLFHKMHYGTRQEPELPPTEDKDDDVQRERELVHSISSAQLSDYCLVAKDLSKLYKTFIAVNRLSFTVHKAECFGLLGINGAGKTTTFKMLSGDVPISAGNAWVSGFSVKTNMHEVNKNIGYCPQFDALFDNLTGWETLKIYCLLRGIPLSVGESIAEQLATLLGFTKHLKKKVHQYSGGNKRKLSTAIALLGDASLIYLDEPTTGMDPASKRRIWRCLAAVVKSGRSTVLTSHSMEECEALCTRLTVMAGGKMHCLGPLQHLKNKFSSGYTMSVTRHLSKVSKGLTPSEDTTEVRAIHSDIMGAFKKIRHMETYRTRSTYYITDDVPWWRVFEVMEAVQRQHPLIDDYSVSQSSLEQLFLGISKENTADSGRTQFMTNVKKEGYFRRLVG